jgi:hypothetical protein
MWGVALVVGGLVALGLRLVAGLSWPVAGGSGVTAAVAVYLWGRRNWRKFLAERAKVVEGGQTVKCWVVRANPSLYRKSLFGDPYNWADVVFTFDRDVPDLDRVLTAIAERVRTFRPGPDATEEERRVASVMSITVPNPSRTPLPPSLTDGLNAYMVATQVMRDLLPEGKLTRPYLWAAGRVDDPEGEVVMVPYRDGEAGA